jgi:hypothetical protein
MLSDLSEQIQLIIDLAGADGVDVEPWAVRDHVERVAAVAHARPADVAAAILADGESYDQLRRYLRSEKGGHRGKS